jgi:SAM-dependent methyltransferase
MRTEDDDYARRLRSKEAVWWKRLLNVQAIYRWNLRREHLGRTLEVGCGIGRNLLALPAGSVGVDHNPTSVAQARSRGLAAFTPEEFEDDSLAAPESFEALLFAHVIEHMTPADGRQLVERYLPYLRRGGTALFICPQERGFASDPTHVHFTTDTELVDLATDVGLLPQGQRSFPFPRVAGKVFTYNEFLVRASKP